MILTAQNIKYSGPPREKQWGCTHRKLCVSSRQQLNRKTQSNQLHYRAFSVYRLFSEFPSSQLNSTGKRIIWLADSLDIT
jgi:hypothetical protein